MENKMLKRDQFLIGKSRMPYFEIELNKLNTLFKWKSEQIEIPYNMEIILRLFGSIGYYKEKNLWVVGDWTGETDDLNRFTTYVAHTLATHPETFTLKREQVIVCANNPLYLSDVPVVDFISKMRSETDVSIYYQLVNSRNIPMLAASDDKVKREIENAFEKMKAGVPVVISTSLIADLQPMDITEKDAIEKMQYLSSFYEVLEKRNASHFGVDIPLVDKKAQVNMEELDNFGDVSTLNFLVNYESRKEFCEEMKKAGIEIDCVRNPVYADEPTTEEIDSEEVQEKKKEENPDPNLPEENQEGEKPNEEESN